MTTPQIYTSLLRLSLPWYISRIDIDIEKEEAHVHITHHHEKMACPTCGVKCTVRDHGEGERVWRHLDLWQAKTFLHAAMPRIDCDKHGVLTVAVPWAEPGSRFSMGFESRVILALLSTKTVEGASAIMSISLDEARGIMERAVARGLADRDEAVMPCLAVDEKSHRKGRNPVIPLMDLLAREIYGFTPGKSQKNLETVLKGLKNHQIDGIDGVDGVGAIAMDMHDPYMNAVKATFPVPQPSIVHDKFHVVAQMNSALDEVRIEAARELSWLSWVYRGYHMGAKMIMGLQFSSTEAPWSA